MNKFALIFGSEGQDGLLLSNYLKNLGYSVYGVSHHRNTSNPYLNGYQQFDLSETDTQKLKTVLLNFKPTEIYYLAAFHLSSQEFESMDEEKVSKSSIVNFSTFERICSIYSVELPHVKIVYTASSLMFAKSGETICDEETPVVPDCFYALHKSFSLDTAKFFRDNRGMNVSVAIMFNHESKLRKENFLSKHIINQVRQFIKGEIQQIVIGDLYAETDWGYAGDYVRALHHINQLSLAGDFVVASGQAHRVIDWFLVLEKHTGINFRSAIVEDSKRLGRKKPTLIGNNSKLLQTGWKPEVSFEQMVIRIYDDLL